MEILRGDAFSRCGVRDGDRVLVALSGGADSVALLLEAKRFWQAGRIGALGAAHLNHGIRGEEASRDESFCCALAEAEGIPFFAGHADVPALAKASGQSPEMAARAARYAFLERVRREGGYDWIAVAHHRRDQAETLLLHLLRGCGTDGLAGMRVRSGFVIRPMLDVSRGAIEAFLSERNQPYCMDSTNAEDDALRNRVRHTLLPLLEQLRPGAEQALCDTALLTAVDADWLNAEADRLFETVKTRSGLSAIPDALRMRVLKRYLPYDGYERADLLALDALLTAKSGARRDLKHGFFARAEGDRLVIGRAEALYGAAYAVPLPIGGAVKIPGGVIRASLVDAARVPCEGNIAYLDAACVEGGLMVRTPQVGERFTPFGMRGSKLLSDYFTDRKVPLSGRQGPVVSDARGVLWIAGHTIDERGRVRAGCDGVLKLEYTEESGGRIHVG